MRTDDQRVEYLLRTRSVDSAERDGRGHRRCERTRHQARSALFEHGRHVGEAGTEATAILGNRGAEHPEVGELCQQTGPLIAWFVEIGADEVGGADGPRPVGDRLTDSVLLFGRGDCHGDSLRMSSDE